MDKDQTKDVVAARRKHNGVANERSSKGAAMPKFRVIIGFSLLMTGSAFAQNSPTPMQCQLVRLAVAQYGYAAARQHALETYGPEAVKIGDKCLTKEARRGAGAHISRDLDGQRNTGVR